ncbi:BREX-2 system phosphatase PglZ [Methylomonas montana]|uniref:BREX-2 system phosphatase PglZ n=1 Tax=Methylomonas montana TaxID=3058963 RepID=UPI002659ECE7|nr:BREX-2 system phosphatase PglZ [Methylomonas montana]WKJ90179.1 BREX-2 system phosphatase PglZ [Methylomonas montana]
MVEAAMVPGPVMTQIQAILSKDANADCIALVWPEPIDLDNAAIEIENIQFDLVYCISELAIREQLTQHKADNSRLVILSAFDETHLAKDVLARLWENEPKRISPWRTLQQLLRVKNIDPRLTGKEYRWIAEQLVSSYSVYQGKVRFGEVLDFDKAWEALSFSLLDYQESSLDLESLLEWSLKPDSAKAASTLPKKVQEHLGDWLTPRLEELTPLIELLWKQGHSADMLAIGLVCSLLYTDDHTQDQDIYQTRGRFTERFLGGVRLDGHILKIYGEKSNVFAQRLLIQQIHRVALNKAFTHTEQILASLDISALAINSDLLPAAFGMRLEQFARNLKQAISGKSIQSAVYGLKLLQKHQLTRIRKEQVKTAEHALRICNYLQTTARSEGTALIIRHYVENGSFLDWARSKIWAGDEHEQLSQAYRSLTKKITEFRESLNKEFSYHLPVIARGDRLDSGIWPVEAALDNLITPLAKNHPVLLLVLDGMSQAVYHELVDDLNHNHWVELHRDAGNGPECLLAALPSVTRVSRYSLLAGKVGEGTSADEKNAFTAHQNLKSQTSPKFPPTLFHKADLYETGSGGLSGKVREIIARADYKVVGAVINAIDDQLSSGAQLSVNWNIESISLLRQVLEAAKEAERLVIFTSDHGHVLDHDMTYRKSETEGERFKQVIEQVTEDEVLVTGSRVVQPSHQVILPWSEKVRYTSKKMGYHGGGSLQEVIIPFGVFRNAGDTKEVEGWHEVPRQEPSWWRLETSEPSDFQSVSVNAAVPAAAKKVKQDNLTFDLFGNTPTTAQSQSTEVAWISDLLNSSLYGQMKSRLGRVVISDDQLRTLLLFLDKRDGQQMLAAVVQELGIPAIRVTGFLAGVQKILNVDGYPVLSIDRAAKTVKLNIESLKKQFEL